MWRMCFPCASLLLFFFASLGAVSLLCFCVSLCCQMLFSFGAVLVLSFCAVVFLLSLCCVICFFARIATLACLFFSCTALSCCLATLVCFCKVLALPLGLLIFSLPCSFHCSAFCFALLLLSLLPNCDCLVTLLALPFCLPWQFACFASACFAMCFALPCCALPCQLACIAIILCAK